MSYELLDLQLCILAVYGVYSPPGDKLSTTLYEYFP